MLIGAKSVWAPSCTPTARKFFNWLNSLDLVHGNGSYRPMDQARFDRWFGAISADTARVVWRRNPRPLADAWG